MMEVQLCRDLAERLADLQRMVVVLEDLLDDPELSTQIRAAIRRAIIQTRERIAAVRAQLEECQGGLAILGVERTQAIQFFSINGQGSEYAPDNSVPLVAQRALVLRVYTDSPRASLTDRPESLPAYISGRVSVDRLLSGGGVSHVAVLTPVNGAIVAKPGSAIDRGDPNDTLNFRLSASDCQGLLRFTVTVFEQGPVVTEARAFAADSAPTVGTSSDASGAMARREAVARERPSASAQLYGRFETVPTLRIRPVLVHYTGGGLDIPAPTALDFATSLGFLTSTYPLGRLEFGPCSTIDFDEDLRTPGEGCGPGWGALLDQLEQIADCEDDTAIYVGLVPAGVPDLDVVGCGRRGEGVAAALAGRQDTLAQEVGHAVNRMHAPGCGATNVDGTYPHYYDDDRYGWATVGEFGFDVFKSQVYSPASYSDFMAACRPRWVSPHTYAGVRAGMVEFFGQPLSARRADDVTRETLFLNFDVHRDGTVDVLPSFHLPKAIQPIDNGPLTDICCELVNESGETLHFYRCRQSDPHQDADSATIHIHAVLSWFDEAASIRFLRDREVLHVHEIERSRPEVEFRAPEVQYRDDRMPMEWAGRHPEAELRYMLRYSHDGGETWLALATDLRGESHSIVSRLLPGGDRCMFQIVASSGIRTAVANSRPFVAPRRARTASILSPERGTEVHQGDSVILRGGAYSPDFGLGDVEDTVWSSNLDGVLGRGVELVAERLSAGRHRITLEVSDGTDGTATAEVSVRVIPRR